MRAFHFGSGRLLSSAMLVAALSLSACGPHVGAYGGVYATSVPYDIYGYPHVDYNGVNAYLVGEQWYYPQPRGWVVLRNEPPLLYRYRTYDRFVQPPSYYDYRPYEYHPSVNVAPPAYPRGPYAYPPPARRIR